MTRYHQTKDGPVEFTSEEETARDTEEAAIKSAKPLKEWEQGMAESDSTMPRVVEDMYDALVILVPDFEATISSQTKQKVDDKKTRRGNRPV